MAQQSSQPGSQLAAAVCAVMQEVTEIQETGWHDGQRYSYVTPSDVLGALHTPMASHGLCIMPTSIETRREEGPSSARGNAQFFTEVVVTFTLLHVSGESMQVQVSAQSLDTDATGASKGMTGALKNALLQTFCLPTLPRQQSRGAASPPPAPPKAPPPPKLPAKAPPPKAPEAPAPAPEPPETKKDSEGFRSRLEQAETWVDVISIREDIAKQPAPYQKNIMPFFWQRAAALAPDHLEQLATQEEFDFFRAQMTGMPKNTPGFAEAGEAYSMAREALSTEEE